MRIFKMIEKIKCFIWNEPYIEEEILTEFNGPILLHISDTPSDIFPYLKKLIKKINPQYIVHTGDMIDNIKLEIYENQLREYEKGLKNLIEILENNCKAEIFYVIGNHDNQELLEKTIHRGRVLIEGSIVLAERSFYVSHYYRQETRGMEFHLYGHSFKPMHYQKSHQKGLNGLLNINVVDLTSGRVLHLDYPIGTNRMRKMERGRIGL